MCQSAEIFGTVASMKAVDHAHEKTARIANVYPPTFGGYGVFSVFRRNEGWAGPQVEVWRASFNNGIGRARFFETKSAPGARARGCSVACWQQKRHQLEFTSRS